MTHSPTIITGDTLVSYLPSNFSHEEKLASIRLVEDIRRAVMRKLPIGFSYNGESRIAIPANLYLQEQTGLGPSTSRPPKLSYNKQLELDTHSARRTIGFDALEIIDQGETRESWKSFHVDQILHLRLNTIQELQAISNRGNISKYMNTPTEPATGHVRNWNYWFRRFIIERNDGLYDLLVTE